MVGLTLKLAKFALKDSRFVVSGSGETILGSVSIHSFDELKSRMLCHELCSNVPNLVY
jgi:hypothetical protein